MMSYHCDLMPDEQACTRVRISVKGLSASSNDDNEIVITGLVCAEADFKPEPGCRLELDLVCYHREYVITKDQDGKEKRDEVEFVLHVDRVYRRFYLEKNRIEAFRATIMNPERFFAEEDLDVIKLMPRWEQKR